ncbi:hypothetical protein [Roseinatronobacter sp.]
MLDLFEGEYAGLSDGELPVRMFALSAAKGSCSTPLGAEKCAFSGLFASFSFSFISADAPVNPRNMLNHSML